MADDEDPADKAEAEIQDWATALRGGGSLEFAVSQRIATELVRIRYAMAAIRRALETRNKIDGGEF
jgi:hypothetical protein